MKTKYLDNEIQLLNSIKRNNEISDYGQEKLNEFIAIKKQLTLTDVVKTLKDEDLMTFEDWKKINLEHNNVYGKHYEHKDLGWITEHQLIEMYNNEVMNL